MSIYFACSPPAPKSTAAALWDDFSRLREAMPDLQLFALIDPAFHSMLSRRTRKEALPLAVATVLDGAAEQLPHLHGPILLQDAAADLVAHAKGPPMLSFLASPLPAEALAAKLRPLLLAETEDGARWPLRFADTRIIPVLLDTVPRATAFLSDAVIRWWWPDRKGVLAHFDPPGGMPAPDPILRLDNHQFARMVARAQPDAFIDRIHDLCPDVLDNALPHENYARVANALAQLGAKGFDSAELQLRWSSLALIFRSELDRIAWFAEALSASTSAADLLARLDTIPDNLWPAPEDE